VNYGTLSKRVIAFSEGSQYRTVEALALGIVRDVFSSFETCRIVSVQVEKPKALLHAKCAGVNISRERHSAAASASLTVGGGAGAWCGSSLMPVVDCPDRIFISALEVYTIVGLNPWEREQKQKVVLDVTIFPSRSLEQLEDRVPTEHNYRTVAKTLVDFLEASRYKTLEALVTSAARVCIEQNHLNKMTIKASKPSALLFAESACVECTRTRQDFGLDCSSLRTLSASLAGDDKSTNHIVYLGVGSNQGDRLKNINAALDALEHVGGCKILDTSFLYESRPMYYTDQSLFLNAAIQVQYSSPQL
jgi:dihydroneopterin aldolase / 2-amino-4-hydroxy-6-hydroxymethyldihydropteridine diphosphokinase / dihydropteroate synthase